MNYAKIIKYDTGNWDGICTTIFFSGCKFGCKGCFNSDLFDFNYGQPFNKEVADMFIKFQQDLDEMYSFIKRLYDEVGKPIHVWTGYKYETLLADPKKIAILELIDTLVDGQFMIEKKDLNLKYRGSSNQRVIDIPISLMTNEIKEII